MQIVVIVELMFQYTLGETQTHQKPYCAALALDWISTNIRTPISHISNMWARVSDVHPNTIGLTSVPYWKTRSSTRVMRYWCEIIVPHLTVYTKAAAHKYMEDLRHYNHNNCNACTERKNGTSSRKSIRRHDGQWSVIRDDIDQFWHNQIATNSITEDYVTVNDLMASNVEHIKSVVNL